MPVRNSRDVKGKAALVTGGGSGIGRACALRLADAGAFVSVVDANHVAVQEVVDEILAHAGRAVGIEADVARSGSVDEAFRRHLAEWGRLDVVVNCAGVCWQKPVRDLTDDEWEQMISVNLDGSFYVARAAARAMEEQSSGVIILISSGQGITGEAGFGAYAASKGGVARLGEVLAEELGPKGVAVNVVNPGLTFTPLSLGTFKDESDWRAIAARSILPRLGQPDDVAELVLFLAGPASRFMSGQHITTRGRSPGQMRGPHDWVFTDARALGVDLGEHKV